MLGKAVKVVCSLTVVSFLTGCGTFTGIPSHGGGKRFTIEQELVAGTARAAIKSIDLSAISGKSVALSIVGMGDQGSGSTVGGRASVSGVLRGQHINTPNAQFPQVTNTTTTGTTVTTAQTHLDAIEETKGGGHDASIGTSFGGPTGYRNAPILNPKDSLFLSSIIQQYFVMNNIELAPIEQASHLVYVNVDVFGTNQSRKDWLISNAESLKAKTSLEVSVIDLSTKQLSMTPQVGSFEAEYKENYFLWMGPTSTTKKLYKSDGLLSDFTDFVE